MKASKYNNTFFYKNKHIWFNALSNEFLILEPLLDQLLVASIKNNEIKELEKIHRDFFNALKLKGFIISKGINELSVVKEINKNIIYNKDLYHLTINPTMNCNFKCWYCYETHIKGSKLSNKMILKIKNHIDFIATNYNNLKSFKLSWFGGEPLLNYEENLKPILIYASNKFNKIDFYSTITTNGLLVNKDNINDFVKYNLHDFQITLDGNKIEHNKVRYISKSRGSYDKIIKNIVLLAKNKINVKVRINYTQSTLNNIEELADFFISNKEYLPFITFDFHQVWQEEADLSSLLKEKLAYFRSNGLISSSRSDIDSFKAPCYADKQMHATINFNGEVFKCTARDFITSNKEGDLLDNGEIKWNNKYFDRLSSKLSNKPCQNCSILPVCGGGCSQTAIENINYDYCVLDFDEKQKINLIKDKFFYFLYKNNLSEI